jgi:hypothetical protein
MRAKLNSKGSQDEVDIIDSLFRFTFMGFANPDFSTGTSSYFSVAPPVGYLDKKRGRRVMALLESAYKRAHTKATKTGKSYPAVRLLERWAEYFFFNGEREKGIGKLQQLVDRYPASAERHERRIEKELGIKRDNSTRTRKRFAKGLKSCEEMDLAVGWSTVSSEADFRYGFAGVEEVMNKIVKACSRAPKAGRLLERFYWNVATTAGEHDYCKDFHKYANLSIKYGRSAKMVADYRQRWGMCP